MSTSPHRRYLPGLKNLGRRPAAPRAVPTPTPSSVVAWAWYVDGVRHPCEDLASAARHARAGHGFVWLGLKDPTDADLEALAPQFDLHPLAIEDAVHGHTRSKLEMFGDDLFMVISTVAYVEHEELTETSEIVATGQMMVFLGNHFVITVRRGEHAQLSGLRRQLEDAPERLARGPSEVLYAVADKIIDDYLAVVAEFEQDLDEVETRVFSRHGPYEVDRVYQLKRELIEFKRSVMPLGAPLLRLATRDLPVIPVSARAYFRELADHHIEATGGGRLVRRGAVVDPAGVADPGVGRRQRRPAQDLGLGGDRGGAHHDRRDLRHELRQHARTALGVRLLRGARGDRGGDVRLVHRVQTQQVVVTGRLGQLLEFRGSARVPRGPKA